MIRLLPKKGAQFWLCPAFFLLAAAPGFWIPVLANAFACQGLGFIRHLDLYGSSLVGHPFSFDFFRPGRSGDRSGKIARDHRGIRGDPCRSRIHALGTRDAAHPIHPVPRLEIIDHRPRLALVDHHHPEQHRSPGTGFRKNPGLGKLGLDGRRMAGQFACHGSVCIRGVAFGRGQYSRRRLLPFAPPLPSQRRPPENALDVLGLRAFRLFKQRDTAMFFGTAFLFPFPSRPTSCIRLNNSGSWVANKLQPS